MKEENPLPHLQQALSEKCEAPKLEVLAFYLAHPDFCDTPENWNTLTYYLPPEFDQELRWPTADELKLAYALARKDGHFRVH